MADTFVIKNKIASNYCIEVLVFDEQWDYSDDQAWLASADVGLAVFADNVKQAERKLNTALSEFLSLNIVPPDFYDDGLSEADIDSFLKSNEAKEILAFANKYGFLIEPEMATQKESRSDGGVFWNEKNTAWGEWLEFWKEEQEKLKTAYNLLKQEANRSAATEIINKNLEEHPIIQLIGKDSKPEYHATSLLAVMWFELLQLYRGKKRYAECSICGKMEDITERRKDWKRHEECYVKERGKIRQARLDKKKRQAKKLWVDGKFISEIAAIVDTGEENVEGWIEKWEEEAVRKAKTTV